MIVFVGVCVGVGVLVGVSLEVGVFVGVKVFVGVFVGVSVFVGVKVGQKLNLKEGHTAEIVVQIDDSQLATAPNTITLWHFDEEKGYWKEDGVATKVGNKYVGEVSHFSWAVS